MKYINLVEKLSEEDKQTMTTYINKYGCSSNFIGIDKWLEQWSHSNQKLYRLLGNTFIKQFPFKYEKTLNEKITSIREFIIYSDFKSDYHNFYINIIKGKKSELGMTEENIHFFNALMNVSNFVSNKIEYNIKYKKPNAQKMLQIQAGAKPLKAIYRVIEYFKDDYEWNLQAFEDFKKKFGIIYSDNIVTGTACISIHPMDYITMSDNASNWQSCMSWISDGCYHVGTIEMMNSNNVLCCYLVNDHTSFVFKTEVNKTNAKEACEEGKDFDEIPQKVWSWNNKKWRKLFYFNKDIIMGGKAYPYGSKELTITILDEIKKLAKENLNYDYEFGPELYKDMIHVTSKSRMENQKMWAKSHSTQKHNIIWDTKGMYNDMLNDEDYEYWCYRNEVKHTKVISVSGKANCLCCNNSIITENSIDENEWYDNDYNERYNNVGSSVCMNCIDDYFKCSFCGDVRTTEKLGILSDGRRICHHCIDRHRICPCCGKIFCLSYIDNLPVYNNPYIYNYVKSIINDEDKMNSLKEKIANDNSYINIVYIWDKEDLNAHEEYLKFIESDIFNKDADIFLEKLACCNDCFKEVSATLKAQSYNIGKHRRSWFSTDYEILIADPACIEPYRMLNLKKPTLEDFSKLPMDKAS